MYEYLLSHGAESNMVNFLRVSHNFSHISQITAKYEKQVNYLSKLHEANVW